MLTEACVTDILNNNDLTLNNDSAYVADTASANFGKHDLVYQELKQANRADTVWMHIIHSCLKKKKALRFDVEVLVMKTYSEFSSSAKNMTGRASFFDFLEMDYKVRRHAVTVWLSLSPAVELIMHSWPALRSYVPSEGEEQCSKVLWRAYSPKAAESLPLCYVYLLHSSTCLSLTTILKLDRITFRHGWPSL